MTAEMVVEALDDKRVVLLDCPFVEAQSLPPSKRKAARP